MEIATTDINGIINELALLDQRIDRILARPGYATDTARRTMLNRLQTRRRALSDAAAAVRYGSR